MSLVQNFDVFAWSPYEVPEVDLALITHKLNVDPMVLPKGIGEATCGSHEGGGGVIEEGKGYKGSVLSRVAIKHSCGEEKKMENGEFVSVLQILTEHARMARSPCQRYIIWWMLHMDTYE